MIRAALATAVFVSLAAPAAARSTGRRRSKLTGTFTGLDLINLHSWIVERCRFVVLPFVVSMDEHDGGTSHGESTAKDFDVSLVRDGR